MAVDEATFLEIMREVPAVVVVVAAELPSGQWRGMTASSFSSVSLAPPLVSVDVIRGSQMHQAMTQASRITFSILAHDQAALSGRFATPTSSLEAQWEGVEVTSVEGDRVLSGAIAWFRTSPHASFEAGDHTIFVSLVNEGRLVRRADPLIYHNRAYRTVAPLSETDDR